MIDLHCHILPGLDDGPETLGEAIEMCRIAADDGITAIAATPHFKPGTYQHSSYRIAEHIAELRSALETANIPIRLLPGADVLITPELEKYFGAYDYLTINGTGKYFLAEFAADAVPPRWEAFMLSFLHRGMVPIITHPERNRWFSGHQEALQAFVNNGGMVQITAMSLLGKYGGEARECCSSLLRRNLVHLIATDAHSADSRPPLLSAAVQAAAGLVGEDKARSLVTSVPEAIIAGKTADIGPASLPVTRTRRETWLRKLTSF